MSLLISYAAIDIDIVHQFFVVMYVMGWIIEYVDRSIYDKCLVTARISFDSFQ